MNGRGNPPDKLILRRILGVDPAAAGPTGYGVVEIEGSFVRALHYGAFQTTAKRQKSSPGACLLDVHELLCKLIREFQPDVMAVESVFTALNMRTALRLAEVRGVVLLAAEQNGIPVCSYSPREVKARIAGYGHADKRQKNDRCDSSIHDHRTCLLRTESKKILAEDRKHEEGSQKSETE